MKRHRHIILSAILLLAVSVLLYVFHYLIFLDPHYIFIYMVGDLAFLPVEVFLVVVIIERLLESHERNSMLQKLNMVIGRFFSELGTHLLAHINGDIKRAYSRLIGEWIRYCRHLQNMYPYMFSFVVRTHPLQANPYATVMGNNCLLNHKITEEGV